MQKTFLNELLRPTDTPSCGLENLEKRAGSSGMIVAYTNVRRYIRVPLPVFFVGTQIICNVITSKGNEELANDDWR